MSLVKVNQFKICKLAKHKSHEVKKKIVLSKRQNHKQDGANFCGLLRKAEVYLSKQTQNRINPDFFSQAFQFTYL